MRSRRASANLRVACSRGVAGGGRRLRGGAVGAGGGVAACREGLVPRAVGVTHVVSVPQGCLVLLKRSRGPDGDSSADEGDGLDGRVPPSERGG